MRVRILIILSCLVLILPATNVLAATLSIAAVGGGKYQVNGVGFSGVAAFDATIKYDSATLSAPQITQGALANGTLFVTNPNIPGQVRLAFVHVSGVSGTGPIAEISFTVKGNGAVVPTIVAASLYDANSKVIALGGSGVGAESGGNGIVVQPASRGQLYTGGTGGGAGAGELLNRAATATATGGGSVGGSITLPSDPFAGSDTTKEAARSAVAEVAPPPPAPRSGEELASGTANTPPPPAKERERRTLPAPPASVLERFRTFMGEPTVAALLPLFSLPNDSWVTQEPTIALADGKATLTVLITLDRVGLESPNFALRGLEMKALKTVGETGWLIEAIPAAGSLQGAISLLLDDAAAELPVLVVPPLPTAWAGKKLTEAVVSQFLVERGTAKAPVGDLNNDGQRDYRDDYIMIGNFLRVTVPVTEKAAAPAETKAPPVGAAGQSEAAPKKGADGKAGIPAKP